MKDTDFQKIGSWYCILIQLYSNLIPAQRQIIAAKNVSVDARFWFRRERRSRSGRECSRSHLSIQGVPVSSAPSAGRVIVSLVALHADRQIKKFNGRLAKAR